VFVRPAAAFKDVACDDNQVDERTRAIREALEKAL
jgi:hypothetical protein